MKIKEISFVKEFTDCPGGRKREHGQFSGEQFRDDILLPALLGNEKVRLDMNGAVGFPSSFLDEVFGVLTERLGYTQLHEKLVVMLNDDEMAKREIEDCMTAHKKP